jgi:uncharacterized protein GlcG (DUF336 family)
MPLRALWRHLFREHPDAAPRRQRRELPPVEHLESRLCLGSMHASSIADWSDDAFDNESATTQLVFQQSWDKADSHVESSDAALPVVEQAPVDVGSNPVDPAVPVPNAPVLTSASLSSALAAGLSGSLQNAEAKGVNSPGESFDAIDETAGQHAAAGINRGAPVNSIAAASGGTTTNAGLEAAPSSTQDPKHYWSVEALRALGLTLDENGNAWGVVDGTPAEVGYPAWWTSAEETVVIGYDFRDQGDAANLITDEQKELAIAALERWSSATGGKVVFEHDTEADLSRIINIGAGDLRVFGHISGEGGVLGLGGGRVVIENSQLVAGGVAWLDAAENWDNVVGNGNPAGTVDFSTVVAHELGHSIGYGDTTTRNDGDMMDGQYRGERPLSAIDYAAAHGYFYRTIESYGALGAGYNMQPLVVADAQLDAPEVEQLLERASRATSSNDAIIAVVDRNGRVLGVRVEADVLAAIPDMNTLVFAIDGAIAKARTAAMFSNGNPLVGTLAPLTSRTVRFLSQSTVTEREVDSNPNVDGASAATAAASTERGPGFVAPIGVGGHFPPDINFTPPVDLFAIEHTNRDSLTHPGPDGIKGTADDIALAARFNINPAFVPAGNEIFAPESWGHADNSGLFPAAQSRGIATLPGGLPLFRDTNGDGNGDTIVGGIGVFFPGTDGTALFEQGFVPGIGQSTFDRTNAPKVLEAEFIAFAAAGGSQSAELMCGIPGAKVGAIGGVAPVANLDLPFGRLDLVGIQLEVLGPLAGCCGIDPVLNLGRSLGEGVDSGADQMFNGGAFSRDGLIVPGEETNGAYLVTPHDSAVDPITAADVQRIIDQGILAANEVRAAVRLPLGSRTKMVFAVTDTSGEVLGLFRMPDATTFSIDVAVAKARNTAYYADAAALQPQDQVPGIAAGVAFTNRTFRYLAEPRFPSGIDGILPPFSILNDDNIDPMTAENNGGPATVSEFTSVLGHDAFFPMTNFRDPDDIANQNGVIFFPGSTPIYKNGVLVGGFGVSGDGVDQDDVVTFVGATGYQARGNATRADEVTLFGVRLPFQKFLRNPWG